MASTGEWVSSTVSSLSLYQNGSFSNPNPSLTINIPYEFDNTWCGNGLTNYGNNPNGTYSVDNTGLGPGDFIIGVRVFTCTSDYDIGPKNEPWGYNPYGGVIAITGIDIANIADINTITRSFNYPCGNSSCTEQVSYTCNTDLDNADHNYWQAPSGQALVGIQVVTPFYWWSKTNNTNNNGWNLAGISFLCAPISGITSNNVSASAFYGWPPYGADGLPGIEGCVATYSQYPYFINGFSTSDFDNASNIATGIAAFISIDYTGLPSIAADLQPQTCCAGTTYSGIPDAACTALGYGANWTGPGCMPYMNSYCTTNLSDATCESFCKVVDCTNIGQAYTLGKYNAAVSANQAIISDPVRHSDLLSTYPESACFLPTAFYDNYYASLQANVDMDSKDAISELPACNFAPCAAGNYKPTSGLECPATQICTVTATVLNTGTISGDAVPHIASGACNLKSTVVAAPACYPNPCPNGQTCSLDSGAVSCAATSTPATSTPAAAAPAAAPAATSHTAEYIVVLIIILTVVTLLIVRAESARAEPARAESAQVEPARAEPARA